jgi:Rrf2 family nitric oxide-sensitive transcriptional repressor
MQLSLHTDYALRILLMLGTTGRQSTIDEIASHYAISRNHLAKVVQALQAEGMVETMRGRTGGLRLAREPDQINVGDLVRRLERFEGFVSCMGGGADCTIDGLCRLKPALAGALEAFLAHLDRFTLADLLSNRREALLQRLAID